MARKKGAKAKRKPRPKLRKRRKRKIPRVIRKTKRALAKLLSGKKGVVFHVIPIRNSEVGPENYHCHVYANFMVRDKVCWVNYDKVGHVVIFDNNEWPFAGIRRKIRVAAFSGSRWYTVSASAKVGNSYLYHVDDILPPPDGPDVIPGGN
jgi:hypothetical protein